MPVKGHLKAGRPKGSTRKPRLSDHLTSDEVLLIVNKAKELALNGSEAMIKLLIEQNFGKAIQPVDSEVKGELKVSFDPIFKDAFTREAKRSDSVASSI